MNHSTSEKEFEKFVDMEVVRCLSGGRRTIQEIVEQAAGIYPNDVLDSLRRLKMEQSVLKTEDSDGAAVAAQASQRILIPHPLDFDWRFANVSLGLIARLCIERTSPRDTLAFLGVPSVFRIQAKLSSRVLALIDRNAHFFTASSGVDLYTSSIPKGPLPELHCSLVIADPPWYPSETIAFLWVAAQLCSIGGTILLSLPPIGTRPGIEMERNLLLDLLPDLGLELDRLDASALKYETPPFEANSLQIAGLSAVNSDWRHGDLAIFRRSGGPVKLPRPSVEFEPPNEWDEWIISGVRIRVKKKMNCTFGSHELISIVKDNILHTVSRREPIRAAADIWTSGNRIFACENTYPITIVLDALRDNVVFSASAAAQCLGRSLLYEEDVALSSLAHEIKKLVEKERVENRGHGYY